MHVTPYTDGAQAARLPSATDYPVALANPETAFARADLKTAQMSRGPLGVVVQTGEHVVVTRVVIEGREYALRCHLCHDPQLAERSRKLSAHLQSLGANAPRGFYAAEYIPQGILVRGVWRPVSLMPWVRGQKLGDYVKANANNPESLRKLAADWRAHTGALSRAQIVHGDPSHANILVNAEGIHAIDPDVAWVPSMGPTVPVESGHAAFQHPARPAAKSSERLDDFPNLVIYVSLLALAADPTLSQFFGSERIIVDVRDFNDPTLSKAFTQMLESPDAEVRRLTAKLMSACLEGIESGKSLGEVSEPEVAATNSEDRDETRQTDQPSPFPHSRRAEWLAGYLAKNGSAP